MMRNGFRGKTSKSVPAILASSWDEERIFIHNVEIRSYSFLAAFWDVEPISVQAAEIHSGTWAGFQGGGLEVGLLSARVS